MPHIILEHTADIKEVPALLRGVHDSLASQETVALEAIKTRAIPLNHVLVGGGDKTSMVHVNIKLLPGRSNDLLNKMTSDIHAIITAHCSNKTSITVEASTLHKESYQK